MTSTRGFEERGTGTGMVIRILAAKLELTVVGFRGALM